MAGKLAVRHKLLLFVQIKNQRKQQPGLSRRVVYDTSIHIKHWTLTLTICLCTSGGGCCSHFLCGNNRTLEKMEPHTGITSPLKPCYPIHKVSLCSSFHISIAFISSHFILHTNSLSRFCSSSAVTIETFKKSHSHWWASGRVHCIHATVLAVKYT